ncbi:uncharacterized protein BT62DRAFT_1000083 [Guyanagaster necrorhizus]|uniref:Uncharacterized protein n=1 Tax=Guyanagaster necrorhizus TaxID=856835 RepID=A0A9P8AXZ8_9AGAR|nr:uncharacterized protein BT62DRAFT_1000083 [Guyanagaster necrorhizus MCA 3950]KAG7452344.1 hypothetical protein BT62DRAFT_1000083 [Guyanagaster necrorhizus MCA 3950]
MSRQVARSMATSNVSVPSSFNLLPVELLHEIVETCNDEEKGPLLATLMATSRRLRNFALPLFFSMIHVTTPSLFNLLLSFLDDSPSQYYSYVRSLKIHLQVFDFPGSQRASFRNSSIRSLKKFTGLHVFEAALVRGKQKLLDALSAASPGLQHLDISWDGAKHFPDIRAFTQLRCLRMVLQDRTPRVIPRLYVNPPVILNHLTTLAISRVSHACLMDMTNGYIFPNLCVLRLDHACRPRAVYHFIDRHPSLAEVNVTFLPYGNPRLYPITKVMQGSPEWIPLSVDTLDFATGVKDPPGYSWASMLIQEMAFKRVPIEESDDPNVRYIITDLALMTDDTAGWQLGSHFMNVLSLGGKIPLFDDVETLTIQAMDDWARYTSFSAFMTELADNLKQWRRIKKFTAHITSRTPFHAWGEFYRQPPRSVLDAVRPGSPLLQTLPPISSLTGGPIAIVTIREALQASFPDLMARDMVEALRTEVINILGPAHALVPPAGLYLVPAWERVNRNTVSAAVLHLAKQCPMLEQFDWYLSVASDKYIQGPLWRWKVKRDEKGEVTSVSGELMWKDRPVLYIMVGNERERMANPGCNDG